LRLLALVIRAFKASLPILVPTLSLLYANFHAEFPEQDFVTCTTCDDFDLCIPCHVSLQHGHHPKHAFAPAVDDAVLDPLARALLEPGRNASHSAVCDGCDKYIYGVRNKCLDCPDWDYCSTCIINSSFIHPGHRFVPIYEAVSDVATTQGVSDRKVRHHGIYCDGPLCCGGSGPATYIVGDRYKCAVCHDTDFCANCETSPSNQHNKTHPLIKIKTPIRNVSVTTMGDHDSGVPHPIMGDRICTRRGRTASKSTETPLSANAATQVQTVADLKPVEVIKAEELEAAILEETKSEEIKSEEATPESLIDEPLVAHFVRDAVQDGTVLLPNCVFEQTWVLRNGGKSSWPAGCTVKFVGGDNMCAVDPEHPASVHELVSAAESTTCFREVAPGQEFGFTVLMRTPNRAGKVISYWRLTGPTGTKFGHRLWCDVNVSEPVPVIKEEPKDVIPEVNDVVDEPEAEHSQMIFPKLDKESPATSIHQEVAETEAPVADDFDEFVDENADLEDDETEDGFLTDEEYDILDASDEEYLAEQGKAVKK
jgi:next-to-BRCA1 protein 1